VPFSIRARLAVWYGALLGVALLIVSVLSYGVYAKSQYINVDRVLQLSANHVAPGLRAAGRSYVLNADHDPLSVVLRLYGPDGELQQSSLGAPDLPITNPAQPLTRPAGPAYDAIARLVPVPSVRTPDSNDEAFGLVVIQRERWRRYVQKVERNGRLFAYVEALSPLGQLDASVRHLRNLLLGIGGACVALVVALGWMLAGSALAPIARLTGTASEIARSRDTSRRVVPTSTGDEVGQLALTFNEMLASLEAATQLQRRFVQDASHELRAPLAVMLGNLELLRRHAHMPSAERTEVLSEVEREAARLARLVSDLLLLARSDAGVPLRRARVDFAGVTLEAVRDARRLQSGQYLAFDASEPLMVMGDADRLKQLALILLDNALKFTPAGGHVWCDVRAVDSNAVLTVRDDGIGIAEEDLPHVFERFYRADPARSGDPGGTGLGLPIAEWVVREHHGSIHLQSHPGGGTTVTVTVPLVPPEAGARPELDAPESGNTP